METIFSSSRVVWNLRTKNKTWHKWSQNKHTLEREDAWIDRSKKTSTSEHTSSCGRYFYLLDPILVFNTKFRYYPICTYEKLRCKKDSPKARENSGNCEKKDLSTELSNSLFFFTLWVLTYLSILKKIINFGGK